MPVQFSKTAVIEKNRTAIDACNQSIARIITLREQGQFPDDQTELIIQRSRATGERAVLRQINAHLKPAGTTVKPMADDVAAELNDLGNRLDQQIRNDLIINASIDFITSVLDDVNRLRTITERA